MSVPPDQFSRPAVDHTRIASYHFDDFGQQVHKWNLTNPSITDPVILPLGPPHILPVIFVPGIMGSNLREKPPKQKPNAKTDPVWRLDSEAGLGLKWMWNGPGKRQAVLHPDRVEVDNRGEVPSKAAGSVGGPKGVCQTTYRDRHWGEVGASSYQDFLLWLEQTLNGQGWDPMAWGDYQLMDSVISAMPSPGQRATPYPANVHMNVRGLPDNTAEYTKPPQRLPLTFSDLQKRANYLMPVHACGYNWLASNEQAAQRLAERIDQVMQRYGKRCTQTVLVTHSMGGLVARRCQMLPGMANKIAGVVHGVMPAVGAAVAYRRCKLGMADEVSGFKGHIASMALGDNGRETTAVFAQAPGALQLLPSGDYPSGWLRLYDDKGHEAMKLPASNDPYTEIYLRKDRWWGLVREAWLAPDGGQAITWNIYKDNLNDARKFHDAIRTQYHDHTYVYYGADDHQRSFANITWRMQRGSLYNGKTNAANVSQLGMDGVRDDGSNPIYVGGSTRIQPTGHSMWGEPGAVSYNTSDWEIHCDTLDDASKDFAGDGTVPSCSGSAPLNSDKQGRVHEQFGLTGFKHEASYKNDSARRATLYAITCIAGKARVPC